jgi:hypothetical protein
MNPAIQTRRTFTIFVVAGAPAASLTTHALFDALGLDARKAMETLASIPAALARNVPAPRALRAVAVLSAFGFRVRLDPESDSDDAAGQAPAVAVHDVAIQPVGDADRTALTQRLAKALQLSEAAIAAALGGPEGLVLRDLAAPQIARLRRLVGRKSTLRLIVSDPQTVLHDAFTRHRALPGAELLRLGLSRCAFSGAVGAGMNRATALHLARRIPEGTLILNRDFQRFDLFLIRAPALAAKELAGFLESRRFALSREPGEAPHRIDADLPYRVAEQFVADYAAIGLDVRARLRGLD